VLRNSNSEKVITAAKTSLSFISAKRYTGRIGDTCRSIGNTQGLEDEEMKNRK